MSELNSARVHQVWKVSEMESVRNGECQKLLWLQVSEWESVRICWGWKVSETALIGKCQRRLRLESVRNSSDWKVLTGLRLEVSETVEFGNCQNWKWWGFRDHLVIPAPQILVHLSVSVSQSLKLHGVPMSSPFLILTLSNFNSFWHFLLWAVSDTFQSQQILTLSNLSSF